MFWQNYLLLKYRLIDIKEGVEVVEIGFSEWNEKSSTRFKVSFIFYYSILSDIVKDEDVLVCVCVFVYFRCNVCLLFSKLFTSHVRQLNESSLVLVSNFRLFSYQKTKIVSFPWLFYIFNPACQFYNIVMFLLSKYKLLN